MKNYYRVMLGRKSMYAHECVTSGFIGTDYNLHQDLSGKLLEEWRMFNKEFIPVYLANNPGKSKVAAGLACGMTWTVAKYLKNGDIVLGPDGEGHYHVGEINGLYYYKDGDILPHRRPVRWFTQMINRSDMSQELRNSAGAIGTTSNLNNHSEEIERLLAGVIQPPPVPPDEPIESLSEFAMKSTWKTFWFKTGSIQSSGRNTTFSKKMVKSSVNNI
jgi:restriction system protein